MGEMRKGGLEDLPFISVVAPATRPLAIAYLLATQRTTRARCEGLGVSDAAKLQLFHKPARGSGKFFLFQQAPQSMSSLRRPVCWHGIYALRSWSTRTQYYTDYQQ